MGLGGIPNDMIQALNAVAFIVLGPIIQKWLYPSLTRARLPFGPIARIIVAFVAVGGSIAFAAGVRQLVYLTDPCYDAPLACDASEGGRNSNHIRVWVQTPTHFVLGFAKILGFASVSEYPYSKVPRSMKAIVQALTQLTACLGSALGMAILPVAKDLHLVIMYAAIAGDTSIIEIPFWLVFHKYDKNSSESNIIATPDIELSMEEF
jgi:proton-dependent oligopeptide transporter, POT family